MTFYDQTFGTIIFPTETLNVTGVATGPHGAPLPKQVILVQSSIGKRVHTATDARGEFHLYLQPGSYTIEIQDSGGRTLSQRQSFAVVSVQQPLHLQPLKRNP